MMNSSVLSSPQKLSTLNPETMDFTVI